MNKPTNHFDCTTATPTRANHVQSFSCPAVSPSNSSRQQGILFCDVETTGLSVYDEIIEIALVDTNENIIYQSLVKPSKNISRKITQLTGITDKMLNKAPKFLDIFDDLNTLMSGKQLIFYNSRFDTRLIKQTANIHFKQIDYKPVYFFHDLFDTRPKAHCLMTEYAEHFGDWNGFYKCNRWQKLTDACHQQRINIDDIPNHRAAGDAIKTARLHGCRDNWVTYQDIREVMSCYQ